MVPCPGQLKEIRPYAYSWTRYEHLISVAYVVGIHSSTVELHELQLPNLLFFLNPVVMVLNEFPGRYLLVSDRL